ncbi:glutamate receptor ionotropic, delta-2-like, partial [Centruroides sculpturatus]|uniref:glutamate receptor ionotropic, delta-2-like n=1 Tax=Centruroides sculpturatus TaxID=218467 RepID=UPI000C6D5ACA
YEIVHPIPKYFIKKEENGSYSGIIGQVINKQADIAAFPLFVTSTRYEQADYSSLIVMTPVNFIVTEKQIVINWMTIVKPFSFQVWIAIGLSILIFGFIFSLIFEYERQLTQSNRILVLSQVIWYMFGTIIFQGVDMNFPRTLPSRLSVGFWLLSALVLASSYSGTLISFLTAPIYEKAPTTFGELTSAIESGKYSCGAHQEAKRVTFDGFKSGDAKIIKDHIDTNNNWVYSEENAVERVENERYAYIEGSKLLNKVFKNKLKGRVLESKDSLITFSEAYYIRKGFPFKHALNKIVIRTFESGILDKIENEKASYYRNEEDIEIKPLTITQFIGSYILLIVGFIIAFICLMGEKTIATKKKRLSSRRNI